MFSKKKDKPEEKTAEPAAHPEAENATAVPSDEPSQEETAENLSATLPEPQEPVSQSPVQESDTQTDVQSEVESGDKTEGPEQKDTVAQLQQQLSEQKDKYLRLMAEFDNYKRRTAKEYERLIETANERLLTDIIEVRENFIRALTMSNENHDYSKLIGGMKLIFDKLDGILKRNGLAVFTEVGDVFNPQIHDAMMKAPHDQIAEDHIVSVYENGYSLKDRVIRHAKVIVSSGKVEQKEPLEQQATE